MPAKLILSRFCLLFGSTLMLASSSPPPTAVYDGQHPHHQFIHQSFVDPANHPQFPSAADFRHSLLLNNKFLYQLPDQKDSGTSAVDNGGDSASIGVPPLLFPLHRPPLMGLPPLLAPSSRGLLLPTPALLPSTFRLPATAMAQHKAFPMEATAGGGTHPALLFAPIFAEPNSQGGSPLLIGNNSLLMNGTDGRKEEEEGKKKKKAEEAEKNLVENKNKNTADLQNQDTALQTSATMTSDNKTTVEEETITTATAGTTTASVGQQQQQRVDDLPSSSTQVPSSNNSGTSAADELLAESLVNVPPGNSSLTAESLDVEAFLRSANLSAQHTAEFMRLLEREVARRLEESRLLQGNGADGPHDELRRREQSEQQQQQQQAIIGGGAAATGHGSAESAAAATGNNRARLELKTVNTRLFSVASGEASEHQQQQQLEGVARRPTPKERSEPVVGGDGRASSSSAITREDYRQREQAEFDRLLSQLAEETRGGGASAGTAIREGGRQRGEVAEKPAEEDDEGNNNKETTEDGDLLLVVAAQGGSSGKSTPIWAVSSSPTPTTTASAAASTTTGQPRGTQQKQPEETAAGQTGEQQALALNRQHRFWSRHGPKNKFERLVEDYRFRLSGQDGQNGLNDLIKALRNAHIGFFDRMASPSQMKILRRIE